MSCNLFCQQRTLTARIVYGLSKNRKLTQATGFSVRPVYLPVDNPIAYWIIQNDEIPTPKSNRL